MTELNEIKIVHIGLGKSATSVLQERVFPEICNRLNLKYINVRNFIRTNHIGSPLIKQKYHPLEESNNIDLPKRFLISSEDLVGMDWRPQNFAKAFEINKKIFSEDCKILITIRKPSDLLNSTYIQTIQNFNIVKEEDFFIFEKDKLSTNNKFNLYYFDYNKLIDLYRSFYKNVIVVKYEDIKKLHFLDKLCDLDKDFKKKLEISMEKYHLNKSFSTIGVKIFFAFNKFFNLKKFQNFIYNKIYFYKYRNNNIFNKIKIKFLAQMVFRNKIHQLDKIKIFYVKYNIVKEKLPIDIDKLDSEYNRNSYI